MPSPMSRRLFVTGDPNRRIHLPCPFAEPGSSLSPGIVPSAIGLPPGTILFALTSVICPMVSPTSGPTQMVRFSDVA